MKKILLILIITGAFILALCNQSILIDRSVSNIPFTPNIFVSPSGVEKTMTLDDAHSGSYVSKLNDSIENCRFVSNTPSNIDRVIGAVWKVKYKNMTPENLLSYLQKYNLNLFRPSSNKDSIFSEERFLFRNSHIGQYLEGRYNKTNTSFFIIYEYPSSYYNPYNKNSDSKRELKEPEPKYDSKKSLKDFLIGAPH